MPDQTRNDRCATAADIAFRRRALKVNCGIYARRHALDLASALVGTGALRDRYTAAIAWFDSEQDWRAEDAKRIAAIAEEIARLGRRSPDVAETCCWHADRLREFVGQHAALARLQADHRASPAWPVDAARRRAPARRGSRSFGA